MLTTIKNALMLSVFATSPVAAKKQTVFLDEEKTLEVRVSESGMTRISFEGDRFQEVLGLEEGVATERDDKAGQLFIKGLTKRQNITVITESGIFQDITLIPAKINSGSVNFKNKGEGCDNADAPSPKTRMSNSNLDNGFSGSFPGASSQSMPQSAYSVADTQIGLVKSVFLGAGAPEASHKTLKETEYGIKPIYVRSLSHGDMTADLFEINNTTDSTQNLIEKDFYNAGDLSVAIGCRQLPKGQKTVIVVVRKFVAPKNSE